MEFKLKFRNNEKKDIEGIFKFKDLDNQFNVMRIISSTQKKYPDIFSNKKIEEIEEIEKEIDFSQMESFIYMGEQIMPLCEGYTVNNEFIELNLKKKEDIENFFKHSIGPYIQLVMQIAGFISATLGETTK